MGKGGRKRAKNQGTGARTDFGLLRRRGDEGPCGLCGAVGPLSRTHVPPQCAGNDHGVLRHYLQSMTEGGLRTRMARSRRFQGGMYVFGLCCTCNTAASRWDTAYAKLASALRSCWATGSIVVPGNRMRLPSAECSPSEVVRSILIGLFGVNHVLRDGFPELAAGLLAGAEPLVLPSELRLRLALARGTVGRLTGAMHSMKVADTRSGVIEYLQSAAAVYFPPLACSWLATGPLTWTGRAGVTPVLGCPSQSENDETSVHCAVRFPSCWSRVRTRKYRTPSFTSCPTA